MISKRQDWEPFPVSRDPAGPDEIARMVKNLTALLPTDRALDVVAAVLLASEPGADLRDILGMLEGGEECSDG
jgi:hypothetical protein